MPEGEIDIVELALLGVLVLVILQASVLELHGAF